MLFILCPSYSKNCWTNIYLAYSSCVLGFPELKSDIAHLLLNGSNEFVRDCSTWYIMSLYQAATLMLTTSYRLMNGCS